MRLVAVEVFFLLVGEILLKVQHLDE